MGSIYGIALISIFAGLATANPSLTVPIRSEGFSAGSLRSNQSLFLLDPSRFGMQQSYSMQYTSTSMGSFSSGVYLNTLSYRFSIPLTLSVDIGMYNVFHQDFEGQRYESGQQTTQKPQFLLPRIGLEYKPTANTTFSLQIMQMNDAYRAYGPGYFYGFSPSQRYWRAND